MTLKIQRMVKRHGAIFILCGRIDAKEVPELQRLVAAEEQKNVVIENERLDL